MARVHIIAGPTAGGKSAAALALAEAENGMVINADSLQLYNALPLLTAQPAAADKNRAPHRLYAVLDPAERCSAAEWRALAIREIDAAHAAGRLPILCGGTGFYLKALLEGLSPLPDIPPDIRAATMQRQAALGNPAFHAELGTRDPAMAARLHPNDTQRLIRAAETLEATGRSLAYWQSLPPAPPPAHYRFTFELISPPRAELYARCNARFDAMMENGALAEAAAYAGLPDSPVTHALGFRLLQACLVGTIDRETAIEEAKAETRQYAKRQVTWFRHQLKTISDGRAPC